MASIQNRISWSAADHQPCLIPLWIPGRLVIHRLVDVGAERHRFWLDGLGHVLKGDAGESTEDWCGRASAKGWRGYCAAADLVRPWLLRATTMIKAAFPAVNAETPTQLCRDLVPQAGSRSQLEAGELSRPSGADDSLQPSSVGGADTDHTIHIARRHMRRWPGKLLFSSELRWGWRWPPEPVTP